MCNVGDYLPPQLIYQGKTHRCHPNTTFPTGWDIWHSENHWSNEVTTKRYIEMILTPFVVKKRAELGLEKTFPALVLFNCFRGQTTDAVKRMLLELHIVAIQIPPNCTDKLQPMGISINKPMKDELKSKFQAWYAEEVQKQLKAGPVEEVKVDVRLSNIKGRSANWMIASWQSIECRPELAINGFRKAGICSAIEAVHTQ